MVGADKLYTPELLALAVALADFPADPGLPLHGEARSKSCGSTLKVDMATAADGSIERLGLQVRACAVGQAAAAIFARAAAGCSPAEIEAAHEGLARWLDRTGDTPDWPGIEAIAAARAYPARHGAIMLPWTAALSALSSTAPAR